MMDQILKPKYPICWWNPQKGSFPQLYDFDWLHENKYDSVYICC